MSNPQEAPNTASAPKARYEEALERYILFWGEMSSTWGVNRTMAQIHALLYISDDPLDTDTIMQRLQISRGNANMNLRSLMNWNLVRKMHQSGSRKDFYYADKDVWQMAAQIIKERERRELRPVRQQLEECRDILLEGASDEPLTEKDERFRERIESMMDLMQVFETMATLLLPFVENRNLKEVKRLMAFASALQPFTSDKE